MIVRPCGCHWRQRCIELDVVNRSATVAAFPKDIGCALSKGGFEGVDRGI